MEPRFESVQSDVDSSFRCLHFTCASFAEDHTWHYHPEYELTWIIRSEGTRFVGDSIQHYGRDDLVLVGPDLPHCWYDEPSIGADQGPELIVVQFRRECFGTDFLSLPEATPLRRVLDAAVGGMYFTGPTVGRVGVLMRAMVKASGMTRLVHLLEVLNLLASSPTLSPLASANYRHDNEINPLNRHRIESVHRYVREHLGADISQAHLAATLDLSPPAFSRFFRAATGQTFVGFVNLLRIGEACRLLGNGQCSVTEIALECGYQNISNFNRQFLALKGMNPSEFRRRLRRRNDHVVAWPNLQAAS